MTHESGCEDVEVAEFLITVATYHTFNYQV